MERLARHLESSKPRRDLLRNRIVTYLPAEVQGTGEIYWRSFTQRRGLERTVRCVGRKQLYLITQK